MHQLIYSHLKFCRYDIILDCLTNISLLHNSSLTMNSNRNDINIIIHRMRSQKTLASLHNYIKNVRVAWLGVKKMFIPVEFLCIQKFVYIISCPHLMDFFFKQWRMKNVKRINNMYMIRIIFVCYSTILIFQYQMLSIFPNIFMNFTAKLIFISFDLSYSRKTIIFFLISTYSRKGLKLFTILLFI